MVTNTANWVVDSTTNTANWAISSPTNTANYVEGYTGKILLNSTIVLLNSTTIDLMGRDTSVAGFTNLADYTED